MPDDEVVEISWVEHVATPAAVALELIELDSRLMDAYQAFSTCVSKQRVSTKMMESIMDFMTATLETVHLLSAVFRHEHELPV